MVFKSDWQSDAQIWSHCVTRFLSNPEGCPFWNLHVASRCVTNFTAFLKPKNGFEKATFLVWKYRESNGLSSNSCSPYKYIYFYIFNNSTVIGHPTLTPRFHNSFCIFYELRRTNVSPIRSPTDIRFNRAGKLSASPSQQGGVCLGSSKDKFIYKWHCLEAKKKFHSGSELALPRRLTTTQPGKAMLTTRRCSSHHISVLYAQWKWRSRSQCILKLNSQLEVMAQLTSNL